MLTDTQRDERLLPQKLNRHILSLFRAGELSAFVSAKLPPGAGFDFVDPNPRPTAKPRPASAASTASSRSTIATKLLEAMERDREMDHLDEERKRALRAHHDRARAVQRRSNWSTLLTLSRALGDVGSSAEQVANPQLLSLMQQQQRQLMVEIQSPPDEERQ